MDSLTLKEKIGQLVQLDGRFFGAEEVPTGPCAELGIEPWVAENAGSVLNVLGAEKVYDVQKRHLEHSRIRLLFIHNKLPHFSCTGLQLGYGAGGGVRKAYRL